MRKAKSISLIIVLLIFLFGGYSLYHLFNTQKNTSDSSTSKPTVTVKSLQYYTLPQLVRTYGTSVSPTSVQLKAQINGNISAVEFHPGDTVQEGQILFRLHATDANTQTRQLQVKMLLSKSYYDRIQKVHQSDPNTVSTYELMQAKTRYQQDMDAYNAAYNTEVVRSPILGVISDTLFTQGSFVTSGTVLATVVSPLPLQVKYQLPAQYLNLIHNGQKIIFYPEGSLKAYSGKVVYVSPYLNQTNYSVTLRADIEQGDGLKFYMFGKVIQILNPAEKILAVSQQFVQSDSEGFFVYSVSHERVVKHYFEPGLVTKDGLIPILTNLKEGLPIITSDPSRLAEGLNVKVVPEP